MPGYNLTRQEAEARARLVKANGYDITLDLSGDAQTFPSTTVIDFDCLEPGAATFLDLMAPAVRQVTLNGVSLDPAKVFVDHRIELSDLKAHNQVTVVADSAYSRTGEGLHRFIDPVDGETYTYTQFEVADARRVFASFEQPDLKSRFTFHVIAPAHWAVISNQPTPKPQPVAGLTDAPAARWDFGVTPLMSSYLTAVIAGPYQDWHDSFSSSDGRTIPLGAFVRQSMAEFMDADEIFDVTKRGFEFYEQAFGVPYPYVKYDQAFVPQYNAGAMENIGAVTLAEDHYIFRSKPVEATVDARANTILHEQAHMWFGDLVTMQWWNDLWLNESFAEYMSHLAAASNTRWVGAWTDFLATRKTVGYQQDQLPTTHPIVATIRDLADVEVNFDMITYAKGASVLKQLVAWVGQEAFLKGVHQYLTKHAWANATLADFLTEIEQASGRDLAAWSKVWLEEAGVTLLRPVTIERPEGVYEKVSIVQEVPVVYQNFANIPHRDLPEIVVTPSLRPHHIMVAGYGFDAHGMTQLWSIETDIDGDLTELPALAGQIIPDLLVVNDQDLSYAKLRLDDNSRVNLPRVITRIEDPLTRALIWGLLWDALRDGELAGRDYIDLALKAVATETSSTTIMSLLARVKQTVKLYVSAAERATVRDDAAARLVALASHADAGSDQQLQFFKAFAALAVSDTSLNYLVEILDGRSVLDGLAVDTGLRWEILQDLVVAGRLGESDIAAELAKDNTLSGQEKAMGARAAMPTIEAKRAAWRQALGDDTISNGAQRSIITGFVQADDLALLREFASAYFAEIDAVWRTRSREMAQNVVRDLYPLASVNDPELDVLAMTDAFLDRLGAELPAMRRIILNRREEVIRARLAQAADAAA
ncbi:MAG: aminopeptidase N [Propionibacteriaceae bacterium]|jgi:aminopeptidase N|nr:aminopeptidase N [Propionibacteriaceae bacterium]